MNANRADRGIRRIAFVATHISGNDGVSLEIAKWTDVLERMGYECYFIAGESDRDPNRSFVIELAHFKHPTIEEIHSQCFGHTTRPRGAGRLIDKTAAAIKDQLYEAIKAFDVDLVIAENCLTIPLNIPLAAALDQYLLETRLPCIAHHHDFIWERERFLVNAASDYITALFPPQHNYIQHVVINSVAGAEFGRRTGLPYRLIPNVMDFDNPPGPADDYTHDFRKTIGLADDDYLILQPTRIVARKGIEHSIELVRRLDDPRCKLVLTHSAGDEGLGYQERLYDFANLLGVELLFAQRWISHCRCVADDGCKCYSVWDAYQQADLVTYPSTYEGFGNAFLEAVYYKKPILCNRYSIYRTDIEPCGFRPIVMDGYLTNETVEHVRRVLDDSEDRRAMADENYDVAATFFSFDRVEHELASILSSPLHCRH